MIRREYWRGQAPPPVPSPMSNNGGGDKAQDAVLSPPPLFDTGRVREGCTERSGVHHALTSAQNAFALIADVCARAIERFPKSGRRNLLDSHGCFSQGRCS